MSDENPDAIQPGARYAANLMPPKGSIEAIRPNRVQGEGGGGGGPAGGTINFKSAGAQRGEPTGGAAPKLNEEELAAAAARSADYQARLKARLQAKQAEPPKPAEPGGGERIGFGSLGTKK